MGYLERIKKQILVKKVFIGIGIIVVVLVALLGAASSFMLKFALSPLNEGKNLDSSWEYMFKNYPELKTWKDSLQQANALKDTFMLPSGASTSTPIPIAAAIGSNIK